MKDFTIYFEGKMCVCADNEDIAADMVYDRLRAKPLDYFKITSVSRSQE